MSSDIVVVVFLVEIFVVVHNLVDKIIAHAMPVRLDTMLLSMPVWISKNAAERERLGVFENPKPNSKVLLKELQILFSHPNGENHGVGRQLCINRDSRSESEGAFTESLRLRDRCVIFHVGNGASRDDEVRQVVVDFLLAKETDQQELGIDGALHSQGTSIDLDASIVFLAVFRHWNHPGNHTTNVEVRQNTRRRWLPVPIAVELGGELGVVALVVCEGAVLCKDEWLGKGRHGVAWLGGGDEGGCERRARLICG